MKLIQEFEQAEKARKITREALLQEEESEKRMIEAGTMTTQHQLESEARPNQKFQELDRERREMWQNILTFSAEAQDRAAREADERLERDAERHFHVEKNTQEVSKDKIGLIAGGLWVRQKLPRVKYYSKVTEYGFGYVAAETDPVVGRSSTQSTLEKGSETRPVLEDNFNKSKEEQIEKGTVRGTGPVTPGPIV